MNNAPVAQSRAPAIQAGGRGVAILRAHPVTQKPGELATAPQADTLGSGLTGRRDAQPFTPPCGREPYEPCPFWQCCLDERCRATSESAEPTATYPLVGQLRMHAGASDTHIPRPMLRKAADLIESLQREIDAPLSASRAFDRDYQAKIERDAATMKVLRILLREAHAFLNAQAFTPEEYQEWETRYKAFTESLDRVAAGVAFITDTRLGGD
jgi:hypothetical protein